MSWPTVELQQLAERPKGAIVSGPFGSNISAKFFVENGVPVIRGNNLTKGREKFIDEGFAYLSESKAAEFRNCIAIKDDIIFTAAGSIGQVGIIPADAKFEEYVISNKQLRVRLDRTICDPDFVFAWLSSAKMVRYLENMNNGGAVPLLNLGIIRKVPVPLPPLTTQRKVARRVFAYDDLIENNRRRIALLEEAARLLYREWFVHFRFPGHEHAKFIDGLPEGWRCVPVGEMVEIHRGRSYSSEELVETDGQPFVNLKCIDRGGGFRISGLKCFRGEHKDHHEALPGDIMIAVTDMTREAMIVAQAARVPKTVDEVAIFSMDLVKAVPKELYEPAWIYGMFRFSRFSPEVREHASGATVLHLKPKHIESWLASVPPKRLRELFAEQFANTLDQIDNLDQQNQKLAQARDLLLPRLMSGELTV